MISPELAQKLRAVRINPSRFKTCDDKTPMYYNYSLDQLLAEIEARGWEADSVQQHKGKYACDIAYLSDTVHTKYQTFAGDNREDAAALALIWIMEQDAHV